jgi:hypothetical protein
VITKKKTLLTRALQTNKYMWSHYLTKKHDMHERKLTSLLMFVFFISHVEFCCFMFLMFENTLLSIYNLWTSMCDSTINHHLHQLLPMRMISTSTNPNPTEKMCKTLAHLSLLGGILAYKWKQIYVSWTILHTPSPETMNILR